MAEERHIGPDLACRAAIWYMGTYASFLITWVPLMSPDHHKTLRGHRLTSPPKTYQRLGVIPQEPSTRAVDS